MSDLNSARDAGYLFMQVTPEDYDPDMDGVDFRSMVLVPGFRTWAFADEQDRAEFRRRYTRASYRG